MHRHMSWPGAEGPPRQHLLFSILIMRCLTKVLRIISKGKRHICLCGVGKSRFSNCTEEHLIVVTCLLLSRPFGPIIHDLAEKYHDVV